MAEIEPRLLENGLLFGEETEVLENCCIFDCYGIGLDTVLGHSKVLVRDHNFFLEGSRRCLSGPYSSVA